MQTLMQPIIAGFSILHLVLIAIGVIATVSLAAAAGFYIARRFYTGDANARMGLYQREMVRQKRRSTDGASQTTLMRRERDRARRHVQRTVRLRQTAQAKTDGRPVKRQYAPVNILRPMALSQQSEVGSVWEPEGALNRVRSSAKSLMNTLVRQPKTPVDDGIDALVGEQATPMAAQFSSGRMSSFGAEMAAPRSGETYPARDSGVMYSAPESGVPESGDTYPAPGSGATYPAPGSGDTYTAPGSGATYPAPGAGGSYPAPEPGASYAAPEPGARSARPAPQIMRGEQARSTVAEPASRMSASARLNAVMGRSAAAAPAAAMQSAPMAFPGEPMGTDADVDADDFDRAPTSAPQRPSQPMPMTGAPMMPMRQTNPAAMPTQPRLEQPVAGPAPSTPVEVPVPGSRASSADLKRRLAQVRERNSAQRAQMAAGGEPMRKSS